MIVMGKEQAMALAEQHDLAVLLITKENDHFKEYTSSSFERLVQVVK